MRGCSTASSRPGGHIVDLGLGGKVAVVTGASKGIGLAVVTALADEGAQVVAGAREGSPELTALSVSGSVHPVMLDLGDLDGPNALVTAAVSRHGGIDILVNNVGAVHPRPDGFLSVTDEDW